MSQLLGLNTLKNEFAFLKFFWLWKSHAVLLPFTYLTLIRPAKEDVRHWHKLTIQNFVQHMTQTKRLLRKIMLLLFTRLHRDEGLSTWRWCYWKWLVSICIFYLKKLKVKQWPTEPTEALSLLLITTLPLPFSFPSDYTIFCWTRITSFLYCKHQCDVHAIVAIYWVVLVVKNPHANAEDLRHVCSIPGSGRSPGEGNCSPLQYSRLENPTDKGVW